jgi:hypothetical protein
VIGDSAPWEAELLRIADRLEKRKTQKRWHEESRFLVERDIMIAAYIIRKLMEAKKLSDHVTGREIVVIQHPLSRTPRQVIEAGRRRLEAVACRHEEGRNL